MTVTGVIYRNVKFKPAPPRTCKHARSNLPIALLSLSLGERDGPFFAHASISMGGFGSL